MKQTFLKLEFLRPFELSFFLSLWVVSLNKDRVTDRPTALAETLTDPDLNGSAVHHQRARLVEEKNKTRQDFVLCFQASRLGEEEA